MQTFTHTTVTFPLPNGKELHFTGDSEDTEFIITLLKDAERYRWMRLNPSWLGWPHDPPAEQVDAEVDKASAGGQDYKKADK